MSPTTDQTQATVQASGGLPTCSVALVHDLPTVLVKEAERVEDLVNRRLPTHGPTRQTL